MENKRKKVINLAKQFDAVVTFKKPRPSNKPTASNEALARKHREFEQKKQARLFAQAYRQSKLGAKYTARWKSQIQRSKQSVDRKATELRKKRLGAKYASIWQRAMLPRDWPKNLANDEVQNYMFAYMRGKKNTQPLPSSPLISNENRCKPLSSTTKTTARLTRSQSLFHSVAKGINTSSDRGLLAWHSTGSGKTLTQACAIHAYWNTTKPIVVCTSVEAKAANPPDQYLLLLKRFFKMNITLSQLKARVQFLSFAQLAHRLAISRACQKCDRDFLNNAVLLIDEVQNLFKPLPNQRSEHEALVRFLKTNEVRTQKLKVFIFTATPGDTPREVATLLSLIRKRSAPLVSSTNLEEFQEGVKGLVMYLDTNNDTSRFPKVRTERHVVTMSNAQYKDYLDAYKKNMAKENPRVPFALARRYAGTRLKFPDDGDLQTYSAKMVKFLSTINKHPSQKHYAYSAFYEKRGQQGVIGMAIALESKGYEKLTPAVASTLLKNLESKRPVSQKKRYCLLITTDVPDKRKMMDLLNVYNHPANRNGELCHVLLASQKFNEGLDLKAVRHLHVFEPLLTKGMMQQAIGRARRYCSHSQYPSRTSWTVVVHEYMSKHLGNDAPQINDKILAEQTDSESLFGQMLHIMKNEAIDCKVFRKFHNQSETQVSCSHAAEDPAEKSGYRTPSISPEEIPNLPSVPKRPWYGLPKLPSVPKTSPKRPSPGLPKLPSVPKTSPKRPSPGLPKLPSVPKTSPKRPSTFRKRTKMRVYQTVTKPKGAVNMAMKLMGFGKRRVYV